MIWGLKTPGARQVKCHSKTCSPYGNTLCCPVLETPLTHRHCDPELDRELAVSPAATVLACHPRPGTQLLPKSIIFSSIKLNDNIKQKCGLWGCFFFPDPDGLPLRKTFYLPRFRSYGRKLVLPSTLFCPSLPTFSKAHRVLFTVMVAWL